MVWSSCLKSIKGENGLGNLSQEVAYLRSMQEIMSLSSTTTTTTLNQGWWYMLVMPILWRKRQEGAAI